MNRLQFWITTGLGGLVGVLLITQILLARNVGAYQNTMTQYQQVITQGQASKGMLQQLAQRIFQDSQKNGGNQALKDLMARQQITFTPAAPDNAANPGTPDTSAPAVTPAPAH